MNNPLNQRPGPVRTIPERKNLAVSPGMFVIQLSQSNPGTQNHQDQQVWWSLKQEIH